MKSLTLDCTLTRKCSENSLLWHTLLMLIAVTTAALPAYSLVQLGLFEDLQIYYSLFSQVGDLGVFETILSFYLQTGKFEPIIFFIFFIQSSFGVESEFWFLLVNFTMLSYCFAIVIAKLLSESKSRKYVPLMFLAFLSYSYFSREIYILRSMYAFVFLLLYSVEKNQYLKFFWFLLGSLTHLSFVLFFILYNYINFCFVKLQSRNFLFFYSLGILATLCVIKFSADIYAFTSVGDSEAFTAGNSNHSFQSILIVIFTIFSLFSCMKGALNQGERIMIYFCLFLCILAIFNFNSYQLLNRIAAPALCITPFIVLGKRSYPFHVFIKSLYVISILASLRLVFLFYSGNFSIPA